MSMPPLSEWTKDTAEREFGAAVGRLRRYFRSFLKSSAAADDVVQQACLKVIESDYSPENLHALLFRTAYRIAINDVRAAERRARLGRTMLTIGGGEVDPRTPEAALLARQELELLTGVLAALPETHRVAFLLFREGVRYQDIADQIGVSWRTVARWVAQVWVRIDAARNPAATGSAS